VRDSQFRIVASGSKTLVKRTLTSGGFEAEFFVDSKSEPAIYHYIVTRKGSADILAWGQEKNSNDAEHAAMDCMHDLGHRSMSAAAS
jgi:hypothetical protein